MELYIAAAKTQHDVVMLASEEVKLDIMIAKSYEDRLALAPEEKDLCLRAQYFWSAALSVSTKYGILGTFFKPLTYTPHSRSAGA